MILSQKFRQKFLHLMDLARILIFLKDIFCSFLDFLKIQMLFLPSKNPVFRFCNSFLQHFCLFFEKISTDYIAEITKHKNLLKFEFFSFLAKYKMTKKRTQKKQKQRCIVLPKTQKTLRLLSQLFCHFRASFHANVHEKI